MLISMFQNAEYPKDKSKKDIQQKILEQWFPRSKEEGNFNFSVTFTNDSDLVLVHRILAAAQGNIDLLGVLPTHLKRLPDHDDAWLEHLNAIVMWFAFLDHFFLFEIRMSSTMHVSDCHAQP
jgi:hypothetical protein